MTIEFNQTVDGRPADVAYFDDNMRAATPDVATTIKIMFHSGEVMFAREQFEEHEIADVYEDPDYIQGAGGRMQGSRARAGTGPSAAAMRVHKEKPQGAAPKKKDESPEWLKTVREMKDENGETVRDLLQKKASPETIMAHPAFVIAQKEADSIPLTDGHPEFGTAKYKAERKFVDADGKEFVGYQKALGYLEDKAESFAGGEVARNREATVVLGPPASGKSSLAEVIARDSRSAIVDPDEAKAIMPEMAGGIGANGVHGESNVLNTMVLERSMARGTNMIIPKVGGDYESINKIVKNLEKHGYKINMVNMEVHEDEAFRRGIYRFLATGRLVSVDYSRYVDGKPTMTYGQFAKEEGRFQQLVVVDGNGPKGQGEITEGKKTSIGRALTRAGLIRQ